MNVVAISIVQTNNVFLKNYRDRVLNIEAALQPMVAFSCVYLFK